MCMGIDPRRHQRSGAEVPWECPRGHEEYDDTPLQQRAYCVECGTHYDWSEVTTRGRVRQRERVAMPAGIV